MSESTSVMAPEQGLPQMLVFAETLVKTGFLPNAIKTPAQAVAVILTGRELGIGPMQALRSINIIQGKPALSAELMLALFKRRGGHAVWKESTNERAVVWLKHQNGDEHTETFTLDDARRAELLGKANWKVYPKAMLRARCASAGLRAIAPDVTAGMYDPDELGAEVPPIEVTISPVAEEVATPPAPSPLSANTPHAAAAEFAERPAALDKPDLAAPWENPTSNAAPGVSTDWRKPWPFGSLKGRELHTLSSDELVAQKKWAEKTGRGLGLVATIDDILASRQGE